MAIAAESIGQGPKKIRLLVIQLARLGDSLQSLMALRAAKQLYPELQIHFVALDKHAHAAKRVPWLESVYVLPTETIIHLVQDGKKTETQALREIASWVRPLVQGEPWDMIVNWSFSDSSSYLTGLIPAKVKLGYSRRKDLSLFSLDGWSHYIQGIVQAGIPQNIHLTDILTTQLLTALQIHFGAPVDPGNAAVTSKGFFKLEIGEKDLNLAFPRTARRWIGVQLGASSAAKDWNTFAWTELISKLLTQHPDYGIVLLGTSLEAKMASEITEELLSKNIPNENIISMVAKMDFDLWTSIISRCHWIITAETAAIHIASLLGTRVLYLAIGPVRLAETGPYGNGHIIITAREKCEACQYENSDPLEHSCRNVFSPEAVYNTWLYANTEWYRKEDRKLEDFFERRHSLGDLQKIKILKSKIRNPEEGGGVVHEGLMNYSLTFDEWNSQVMGHLARFWYCGWTPPLAQEIKRSQITPALIQSLRKVEESTRILEKIFEEAHHTANVLSFKSSKLISDKLMPIDTREQLRDHGKKLMELEELTDRLALTDPALRGFAKLSKVLMHNLSGDLLSDLSEETAKCYQHLQSGVKIMSQWAQSTMKLVRPMAIVNSKKNPEAPL